MHSLDLVLHDDAQAGGHRHADRTAVHLGETLQKALMSASSTATAAPDWFKNNLSWKILKPPGSLRSTPVKQCGSKPAVLSILGSLIQ